MTAEPSADLGFCDAYYWDTTTSGWSAVSTPFGGTGQPDSYLFTTVPPGDTPVTVRCVDSGGVWTAHGNLVAVSEPNPFLDFIDNFLVMIGLGSLASDPTLA